MNAFAISTKKKIILDFLLVPFALIFLISFAKIQIPLFFTPIPLTLQNSIAVFYGLYFKSKKASIILFLFLLLGAFNMPVFAYGNSGINYLCSISGGYLFGYLISAYLIGKFSELKIIKNHSLLMLLGHFIILFTGFLYFSTFVGLKKGFLLGFLPFIFGDIIKTIIISKIYKRLSSVFW
ncbi:MAG: hypothetical protein A3F40_02510 [Chlamydiae bacterium RIFCSPHIGHO2_12_FULL_27_8]|nr:MAG: hypothetical protein A3F40_02510 [Chlamydiae bacterium RIFCSPHIGHO2_12_FULL_27_8]OGN64996.1 MAG: hypothetical protein A2888_02055 [Chlamydiae bacterium RIFCSPLOWO2_01_FULL_28_7]